MSLWKRCVITGRSTAAGMDELWRFAKICRVERVMRPYLEALT